MKRIQLLIPVLGVALIIAFSAFYIVDEREKALRLWFGEVTAEIEEPGLYFKIPLFGSLPTLSFASAIFNWSSNKGL